MKRFQLFFHHFFRFIWNAVFVLSYPIMATFGILFVGMTYFFSGMSKLVMRFSSSDGPKEKIQLNEWKVLAQDIDLIEGKVHKQILFGPACYRFRRTDGIPSVLEEHIFGKKIKALEEGILLERWNSTDTKELPDFDICLYVPDDDRLTKLAEIRCFDWHLAEKEANQLHFKWFDGTQGGDLRVAL